MSINQIVSVFEHHPDISRLTEMMVNSWVAQNTPHKHAYSKVVMCSRSEFLLGATEQERPVVSMFVQCESAL